MGADQSTPKQSIYPQLERICATQPRFCLPHNIQLRVSMSADDFQITNARSGTNYFNCKCLELSLRKTKVLLDEAGVAVLNMEKVSSLTSEKFNIFAGTGIEWQIALLKLQPTFRITKMSAVFPDALTSMQRHLVLKGDWIDKQCTIYLDEPKEGGIPLARIYRPHTLSTDVKDYIIEIAANVDVAICVIMCIATDAAVKNNNLVEEV